MKFIIKPERGIEKGYCFCSTDCSGRCNEKCSGRCDRDGEICVKRLLR
ncbi:MAG: Clo7bot family Cys-rich peptide [Clostridia bacterium]|nr:Clo7bot family Cys-rich peptide [Clostridia bacterium]